MGDVILSVDLFEVVSLDCATSPLLAPVLFEGDSAQATRPTNSVNAIARLRRYRSADGGEPSGRRTASASFSACSHALKHRQVGSKLGRRRLTLVDLIDKIARDDDAIFYPKGRRGATLATNLTPSLTASSGQQSDSYDQHCSAIRC